jgi:hypothetical protein
MVVGLIAGTIPAQAQAPRPDGIASMGWARVVRAGVVTDVPQPGSCDVHGPNTTSSPGVTKAGLFQFGSGTASCSRDSQAGTSTSSVSGSAFVLSALVPYGGPTIRIGTYRVTCTATRSRTTAAWTFDALSGVSGIPVPIPAGYSTDIASKEPSKPLARIIFNEVLPPPENANDGSVGLNMVRIKLFPNGMPDNETPPMSGEMVVGSAACAPVFP